MKRNSWVFMMTGILLFAMFLIPGKVYGTVFVDVNAPVGTNDGSSWTNAYLTIQAGIDASAPGDEIWVADGTYFEAIVLADTGDILYGGFEGHGGAAETLLSQRDWQNNESTVDASTADAGNPAIHVVSMVASVNTRFDGFTVTGGHADGAAIPDDSAAGIFLINTNDTNIVTNCLVRDNVANYGGGGIGGAYSDAQIIDCTITENYAYDGAGIAWPYGILNISGCTITGNIATRSGGGISGIECGSVTISDCVITGNEAPEGGAGVGFYDSPLTIIDCDISNNTGTTDGPGAGVFLENQISGNSLEIAGCVINNNNVTAPGPRS
ncbi:MAG: right-handed parallel beta-helix repeat-containing protein, partial [Candidatus Hydrogenedentes bacterium]|nr:right-handed parallel beta-helix repeat-containing protein [Candidatus Hydrogenedentota bacterium]